MLEQLADLLEGSDFHRIEGEDLAAMRAEARRKLDDINEVGAPPDLLLRLSILSIHRNYISVKRGPLYRGAAPH